MFDRDAISGTRPKGLRDGETMMRRHFDRKIWVANGKLPHYYVIKGVCDGRRQVPSGKYRDDGSFFDKWREERDKR
jgi:hypothetical protein